jgi:hypothetical protein
MAINIDIAANVRSFQGATRDVSRGLDDVADSLDDLARDTQRSAERAGDALSSGLEDGARDASRATQRLGDDIGDNVQDGTRDAERATEQLERSFRDLADGVARSTRTAGTEVGTNVRRGTDDASEGLGELRDEANGTAREAAASFDGSAASIGDAFQEVAANAFAGFGPAGAAAGLAAAAGLGLIFAQLEKNGELTDANKEAAAELAAEYIETGRRGEASIGYLVDQLKELATATGDGETSLRDLRDAADKSGSSYEDLARAYSGNADGIDELIEKNRDLLKATEEQLEADQEGLAYRDRAYSSSTTTGLEQYIKYLEEARDTAASAADQQRNFAEAGGPELEAAAEAAEDYSSAVQDAYADAGAAIDEYVEDGVFNLQKYTEESQKQADAVAAYQQNMVTLSQTLSDEALSYIASLGPEAAPLIDAFVKAPLAQQQQTADVWSRLGQTSTDAFGNKVETNLNGANFSANVRLDPDASAIRDYLNVTKTQNVLLRVQNRIDLPANQGMGVP